MTTSFCPIDPAELANVTGGARVVVNGVEYGPGTYVNGVKVDDGSGSSTTINQGSNTTIVISR